MIPDANAQFVSDGVGPACLVRPSDDAMALIVCRFGVDLEREILLRRTLESELDRRDERVG